MMLITLPFFMPLVQRMDIDPIWFGVLFLHLHAARPADAAVRAAAVHHEGVAPPSYHHEPGHPWRSMPYMYFGILIMLIVFLCPPLATWLPAAQQLMSRSPRLDDLLPYLMNRLVGRLNQNLGERLRRDGYSFQDWRILAVLAAHDGITLSQLAEATVIPQPTVSRLVASLARRGLLRRRVRTGDSRFVEARITARGEAAYRKMLPLAVAEYRSAVVGFDKAEAEGLKRAVLRMLGNIGVELLQEGNHSGSTAVASISRRARGSTNRVTSTTAMAGKCRPMTSR